MSRLDAISDWAERAAAAKYDPAMLASLCGVSPSQLRRYFAIVILRSPGEWLREIRLWRAAKLLCSGLSIKEVVWELGFPDKSLLCRQFREYHGCSPMEFVRVHRLRVDRHFLEIPSFPSWQIAETVLCGGLTRHFSAASSFRPRYQSQGQATGI